MSTASRRKTAFCLAAIALAATCAVGMRIWWVNAHAVSIPTLAHAEGEWVDLDGAFSETAEENTDGYRLRIADTWLMSADDYLEAYSADGVTAARYDGDATIVVAEVEIDNEAGSQGYMDALTWRLIPQARNDAYYIDWELFDHAEPAMNQAQGVFGIKPGTVRTVFVPFCKQKLVADHYLERLERGTERSPLDDSPLDFVFTSLPVQHVIEIRPECR